MKKIFAELDDHKTRYSLVAGGQTKNFELQDLWFHLESDEYSWLHVDEFKNKIYLWSEWSIKDKAKLEFATQKEKKDFDLNYSIYNKKRFWDMPKLEMSKTNYDSIVKKWNALVIQLPKYIIFSQDDYGIVNIVGKDELSGQDLIDIKLEHDKYLRYKVAREKYIASFDPARSNVWRSPADDEYEAEFLPFLDEDLRPVAFKKTLLQKIKDFFKISK